MATSVNRSIVTDGLVACFDAASPKSWSGAAPWVDLSSFSSNGTGDFPTYTGINNGALAFNGTSNYIDYVINTRLNSPITIEMWFRRTGKLDNKLLFGFSQYSIYTLPSSRAFGFNTGAGDVYGVSTATADSLGMSGNWRQGVFVMHSGISYTNNKMYINTSGQTLSAQNAIAENTGNRTFNGGSGRIGHWRHSLFADYFTPMQCSIFRLYNKELSQDEINQNFEATKIRYSL